jgi:16S rRNA (cytosine1402-N4)-methyltransferase
MYHKPVLLNESIEALSISPNGVYVDVTFGGGGHSREILKHLGKSGLLIAIDQDSDARQNVIQDDRFKFVYGNFRYLKNYLRYLNIDKVDGILADLGVSSHQFDIKDRGFSHRLGGELDMRMNKKQNNKAIDIINNYSERELMRVFRDYCDINNYRKLTNVIVENRNINSNILIQDFVELIKPLVPINKEIKFLSQVFQALRIEVNDEINSLKEFLESSIDILKPNARLVVISYHSLEDRLVKNLIKTGNVQGRIVADDIFGKQEMVFRNISRKLITPDSEEINDNSRSKAAKLRVAEKI